MTTNKKIDLFVDWDSTIVNSEKAFCEVYNKWFKDVKGFKPADWTRVTYWDFNYVCPLIHKLYDNPKEKVKEIFSSQDFFDVIEFFPNAYEALKELSEDFRIIICTMGTPKNIARKVLWIEKNMPFIRDIIPIIHLDSRGFDKSKINMKNGIILDDHVINLKTSNAKVKILHNEKKRKDEEIWEGLVTNNWLEVKQILLTLKEI